MTVSWLRLLSTPANACCYQVSSITVVRFSHNTYIHAESLVVILCECALPTLDNCYDAVRRGCNQPYHRCDRL